MFNRIHRTISIHRPEDWSAYVPLHQTTGTSLIEQIEPLRGCASVALINILDLDRFKAELWDVLFYWGHGYHQTLWDTENGCEVHISNAYPEGKILFETQGGIISVDLPPPRKVTLSPKIST